MGGKSSSSSSSSTKYTTNTTYDLDDYRLAQEQGAIGVTSGGTLTINMSDQGAMDAAVRLGEGAFEFSERIVDKNAAIVGEAVEDNAKEISQTLIKGLFGTVAVAAIMWGLRGK